MSWVFKKCSSLGLRMKPFTPTLFTAVPAGHLFLYGSVTDVRMGLFSVYGLGYCVSHLKSCCVELTASQMTVAAICGVASVRPAC